MAALHFTRASGHDVFSIESTEQSSSQTVSTLSGEEARHFYENVMKDDEGRDVSRSETGKKSDGGGSKGRDRECGGRVRRVTAAQRQQRHTDPDERGGFSGEGEGSNPRREPLQSERTVELLGLRFLRCAQEGNVSELKDLLSKGVDINFQDTYLWTAMMCACWAGKRAAVKLLLRRGAAWVGVVDTQGRDARELALEAGNSEVLEELESYGGSTSRETQSESSPRPPHWCSECGTEYSSSLSSHLSSTLHQFSVLRPSPTPYYCLPPSSAGYKMMLRSGWTPGAGLGPGGVGPKQPVPTVLKRDSKGLGYGQTKRPKVTHFQARDRDAVKAPSRLREDRGVKGQKKEECRRKEQKDKTWERDFRASFYL